MDFYTKLNNTHTNLLNLLSDENLFSQVPNDWHIVVVDVQNSTKAVNKGNHHQVNLTATGAIISVLNTIRKEKWKIEIPYFFGGDGATFLVPNDILKTIIKILENYRIHIKNSIELTLRVGHISVEKLGRENYYVKIAKHKLTEHLTIPIVLGDALKQAEKFIKKTFIETRSVNYQEELLNLEGMECRWKEITSPKTEKKIICLLIDCLNSEDQREIYGNILSKMDELFGTFKKRQPITPSKLKLDYNIYKIWKEMKISLGKNSPLFLLKNWFITLIGSYYFSFSKEGKYYLKQISQLSHTFMLDGMINTIFTAEQKNVDTFVNYLDMLEQNGKIVYGIHVTYASIMSCYVVDRKTKHSHFVDGTEGGYTSAAKIFKQKINKSILIFYNR